MTNQELNDLAVIVVAKLEPKIKKLFEKKFSNDGIEYNSEQLTTQKQLAELIGVHPNTLHGKTDIYPHVMVGSRKRFLRNEVLKMLANQ